MDEYAEPLVERLWRMLALEMMPGLQTWGLGVFMFSGHGAHMISIRCLAAYVICLRFVLGFEVGHAHLLTVLVLL